MIKNYLKKLMFLFIALAFSGLTYGQYLTESFEGAWSGTPAAPSGWSIIHTTATGGTSGTDPMNWTKNTWSGTAWNPAGHGVPTTPAGAQEGSSVAWFNDFDAKATQKDMLVTPVINLSSSTNPLVSFYLAINASSSTTIKLRGSIDGGSTWNDIQTITKPGVAWSNVKVILPAMYKVANVKLGIEVIASWGSNDVWIDNVEVKEALTPAAPINFTATNITPTETYVYFTDNSTNEAGFRVYYSVDSINYSKFGPDFTSATVAATGDEFLQMMNGLLPGTKYYYKIVAYAEAESVPLVGIKTTFAAGEIYSIKDGNWNDTLTWNTNKIPTNADNVTITNGDTVTLNANGIGNNITVNGTLSLQSYTLSVINATVSNTGIVNIASGTIGTISVAGNLTNNGVMDFYSSSSAYGKLLFTGAANNSFNCDALSTTDIGNLEINKGTTVNSILEINTAGTFTIKGLSVGTTGFLTLTKGTLKISGNAVISNPVFLTNGYSISANCGFWLNNPNFVVTALNGSPTNNGLLRITTGTYNVGTGTGNSLGGGTGAIFTIEGGILNLAARMQTTAAVTLNISGGVINVNTVGNTSGSACFGFTSASNTINISGGTINLEKRSTAVTPLDYNVNGANVAITGGVLNIGTPTTATNFDFRIQGLTPSINIDTVNNKKSVLLSGTTYVYGDVVINSGATLNLQASVLFVYGNATQIGNVVNNGIITQTSGSTIPRFSFNGSNGSQTYSGTGVLGSNTNAIADMSISNPGGVTIGSPIIVNRVNLFNGLVTGSNKITLGTGGTSTPIVQKGGTATVAAGSFDQAPIVNAGTSYSVFYSSALNPYSSGFELTDTISGTITISTNVDVTLTKSVVTEKITFSSTNVGKLITTNANLLLVRGTATTDVNVVAGNTGYVSGPMAITLPASLVNGTTFKLPIGKGTANMMELVSPTTTADGKVVIKAEVVDAATGGTAGIGVQAGSMGNRYWVSEIVSGATNFKQTTVAFTQDAPALAADNVLAKSATLTGTYTLAGSLLPVGNKISSDTINTLGYFVIGVNSIAPTVAFNPLTGATAVPVGNNVVLTFSEDVRKIDNSAIDASVISFKKVSDNSNVAFTPSYSDKVLTVTPNTALAGFTEYSVTVSGVEDFSNNLLTGSNSTTFTTGTADALAPLIDSIKVLHAAPANVVVYFNENVKVTDATGVTINVAGTPATINNVSGSTTKILTFTLSAPVAHHTTVTFSYNTATGNIKDVSDNALANVTDAPVVNLVKSTDKDILTFAFLQANNAALTSDITGNIVGTNITLTVPGSLDITALIASFTTSNYIQFVKIGTDVQVSGTTANNFTTAKSYVVTAEDGTTKTYTVTVNKIFNIPLVENFDGVTAPVLPNYWKVESLSSRPWATSTSTPISAPNSLRTTYHGTLAKNEWIYTPALNLDQTKTYVVTFKVQAPGYSGTPEKMEVKLGSDASSTSMTTQLWNDDNMLYSTATEKSFTFSPTTSGVYYLAWHAYSIADVDYIKIDDITIKEAAQNDASVVSVSKIGIVKDNQAIVKANVKNAGLINATFDVKLVISQGATELFTDTKSLSNIASGVDSNIVFEPYTMSNIGEYTTKVFTMLSGDEVLTNDTVYNTISVLNPNTVAYAYSIYSEGGVVPNGPVIYDLASPNKIYNIANHSADVYSVWSGDWVDGVWYANDTKLNGAGTALEDSRLITINKVTGEKSVVKSALTAAFSDMAYDYTTNTMFGISTITATTYGLYTINLTTGDIAQVGTTGTGAPSTLACNLNGQLFSIFKDGKLYSINKTDGSNTLIGSLGFTDIKYIQSMGFDHNNGDSLYWNQQGNTVSGGFYRINTTSGIATTIGQLQGDAEITAFAIPYSIPTHTVTFHVTTTPNGTLAATVDGNAITSPATVKQGKSVVFTATPDAGYRVKEWKTGANIVVGNTSNNFTLSNLVSDSTVTVEFELIPATTHVLTYNVVNGNGSVTAYVNSVGVTSPANVVEGSNVVFEAVPALGYRVKEWKTGNTVVAGNTTNSFTLNNLVADTTVTVEFEIITYTVSYSIVNGINGILTATVDGNPISPNATVVGGKDVVFTATPDANYEVKEWKLDNVVVAGNTTNNYTLTNLSANSTVTVEFKVIVGIEDATENTFSIYPVPANDFVNVKSNAKMSRIAIVNIHGQVVSETIVDNDNANINTSNLSNGMYQLRIETANGITVKKIQINK